MTGSQTSPEIPPEPQADSQNSEESKFLWELIKHEDGLFTNRGNFFLLGEAMLLAAVAALIAGEPESFAWSRVALCGAGGFVSLVWFVVNLRHICTTEAEAKREFGSANAVWENIRTARKKGLWWLFKTHVWTGLVLPAVFLAVWGILCADVAKNW